jgi:EF hand domain-containing protein
MKKTLVFAAAVALLSLPTAFAKDPNKKGKDDQNPAARFDTNGNGKIDKGEEADALRAAFDADKDGPLKKYDTNHNGNLEDSEIAAIHVPIKHGKRK